MECRFILRDDFIPIDHLESHACPRPDARQFLRRDRSGGVHDAERSARRRLFKRSAAAGSPSRSYSAGGNNRAVTFEAAICLSFAQKRQSRVGPYV